MTHPKQPPISDETLLGYILQALPEEECASIDELLFRESAAGGCALTDRICALRELLDPIQNSFDEVFEPSPGLADRTLQGIELFDEESSRGVRENPSVSSGFSMDASGKTSPAGAMVGMSSVLEAAPRGTKVAWLDSLAVIAAGVTILCLIAPSIWEAREQARKIACANRLKGLGMAMQEFACSSSQGEFPCVEIQGPLAFAGVYSIRLNDAQLLDATNFVWCPSRQVVSVGVRVPSYRDYLNATPVQQSAWQRTAGGTYAYNLGYVVDGTYKTPRIGDGLAVPLVGDMLPLEGVPDHLKEQLIHGVTTVNLLYTDGRVSHLRLVELDTTEHLDHPYRNKKNLRAVGLGYDDTCLAPSFVSPLQSDDSWYDLTKNDF